VSRGARESGQASIELIGAVPVMLVAGAALFQLLAVGAAFVLAGTSAEAGALALAVGGDPYVAARNAIPGSERNRLDVQVDGGWVHVWVRPRSAIPGLLDRVEISSSAYFRAPGS
jgi:hypothetical protein